MSGPNPENARRARSWITVRGVPGLRGVLIVDARKDGHDLIGVEFPWQQVDVRSHSGGVAAFLYDSEGRPLQHRKSKVSLILRGGRPALRLKRRAAKALARMTDAQLGFRPVQLRSGTWALTEGLVGLGMLAGGVFFLGPIAFNLAQRSSGPFAWLAVVFFGAFLVFCFVCASWMFRLRPRSERWEHVQLDHQGMRLTPESALPIRIGWGEVRTFRVLAYGPMRVRFTLADRRVVQLAVPPPTSQFLLAMIPEHLRTPSRRVSRSSGRPNYWIGVRIAVLGLVGGIASALLFQLAIIRGWIVPLRGPGWTTGIGLTVAGLCQFIAALLLWETWSSTPRGRRWRRRTIRRLRRSPPSSKGIKTLG